MHTRTYMTSLRFFPICAITLLGAIVACSPDDTGEASSQGSELGDREDLYDKSSALEMRIEVPLTTLFTRFKSNQADPKAADAKPNAMPEFSEPAKIIVPNADGKGTEKTFEARIGIRGESSKHDCPFPKLKIDFNDKEALKGTLFKGHSTVRINTHCGPGDMNARSGMGRIMNGVGPAREELIYRIIRAADVPTYFTRLGKISYVDSAGGQSTSTYGMLFESGDDAAQRYVKANLIEAEGKYLDQKSGEVMGKPTPENLAKITVAEGLAGNRDFGGTHNIDTFGIVGAPQVFQIPQDFDLCAITTANAPGWTGPITAASNGLKDAAVVAHFASHKADMQAAIEKAEADGIAAGVLHSADGKTSDDPGFKIARERVQALFELPELKGK